MIICLILLNHILSLLAIFITTKRGKKKKYRNKRILIIGGTSGLGLSLAFKLSNFNKVIVTGRKYFDTSLLPFDYERMDVKSESEVKKIFAKYNSESFDAVFFCAGYAVVKYFKDIKWEEIRDEFEVNYFGALRVLKCLIETSRDNNEQARGLQSQDTKNNDKRDFIMIGTPLTFFPIGGYSAYSPSKSALYNFFCTIRPEIREINFYFYILSSTKTRGYSRENEEKPSYTKKIEGCTFEVSPDERSDALLNAMRSKSVICSDWMVHLMRGNMECGFLEMVFGWAGGLIFWGFKKFRDSFIKVD